MIYIFGNIIHQESQQSFVEKLNRIEFLENDKFVHLNRCVSFYYGIEFFKDKENYSMHNTDSKWNAPMGFYDMLENNNLFKESIFHRFRLFHNEEGQTLIEKFNTGDVVNQLIKYEKCEKYKYPDVKALNFTKSFTLGFYSYFFFRRYLKDAVTLVNFYGPTDQTYNSVASEKWHDLLFERNYLKSINANIIMI